MKFKQKHEQEFPACGSRRKVEDDGFGHMVEEELEEVDEEIEPLTTSSENILKVDPSDFVYDEVTDTIKPVDVKAFEVLVENHPYVYKLKRGDKRDDKIAGLKTKVLDTLKVKERRNRDLTASKVIAQGGV